MTKAFSDAAFELNSGQLSDVVRTRFGFHLIRLEERRSGGVPEFDLAKDRVIEQLKLEKRQLRLEKHLQKLRKRNKVIVYYN